MAHFVRLLDGTFINLDAVESTQELADNGEPGTMLSMMRGLPHYLTGDDRDALLKVLNQEAAIYAHQLEEAAYRIGPNPDPYEAAIPLE